MKISTGLLGIILPGIALLATGCSLPLGTATANPDRSRAFMESFMLKVVDGRCEEAFEYFDIDSLVAYGRPQGAFYRGLPVDTRARYRKDFCEGIYAGLFRNRPAEEALYTLNVSPQHPEVVEVSENTGRKKIFFLLNTSGREMKIIRVEKASPPDVSEGPHGREFEVCALVCPFSSIQDAIDISADGDTVVVHEGTYTENIDFLGKLITVVSLDGARRTIIRGQLTPLGEPSSVVTFVVRGGQEEYRGAHGSVGQGEVLVPSSGKGPVLDGFTITGGSGSRLRGVKNAMTPTGLMNIGTFGGGVHCDRTSPTIANCIIRGNSAGGGGGGISSWKAYPRIVNCVISGNRSSRDGGGIYCGNGTVRLEHTTVTGNAAGRRGGGISCYTSALSVAGSIVWGNMTNGASDNIRECDRLSRIAFSAIGGPGFRTREEGTIWPGEGNIKADPLFREAVYAEESPTTAGDYRLTAGSPAVDSGAATGPDRDLDGVSRPQGGGRDMGAYELTAGPSVEESPFGDQ